MSSTSSGDSTACADGPHLGDWAKPSEAPEHPATWLEEQLGPKAWAEFIRVYGGRRFYFASRYDYSARDRQIQFRCREMELQGVRRCDAVRVLARETRLSRRRVEQIVGDTK